MRRTLRWLHRVFGLAGAVWLFLVGFTGTLLVFCVRNASRLHPGPKQT